MIRVVLDTNVLASGATHHKGPSGLILTAWRRSTFELVVSDHILEELATTLEDRYFKKRLTRRERQRVVSRVRRPAHNTDITARVEGVAPHAEDDLILATAESAGAEYVVTGDEKFQAVKEYHGILIVSPREFLDILKVRRDQKKGGDGV